MRRGLRIVGFGIAGLGLCGALLLMALQPPRIPVPERRDWVFRDVTLVEAGASPRLGRTLRIVDGKIAEEVSESARQGPRGASAWDSAGWQSTPGTLGVAEAPDLAGLFVAPGLVDLHVHYPPAVAVGNAQLWSLLLLAHGVTSVRETGSIDGSIFGVRDAIMRGDYPGPRIFACGAILDGAQPSFPSNRVVRTRAEARAAVEEEAERGADCIKAYNMLSPDALAGIHEAARERGLPVIGHAPHSVDLETAGLVDLQHGTGAVEVDLEKVGRQDFRFEDWAGMDAKRIAYAAQVSRAQGIAHTPTLVNGSMRRWLVPAAGRAQAIEADSGLRHLPRFWFGVWELLWGAPYREGDALGEEVHDVFQARQRAFTAALHEAGVQIHAGTDTLMPFVAPGSSLHGELAELERAGIPGEEAWQLATRDAGEWLASAAASRHSHPPSAFAWRSAGVSAWGGEGSAAAAADLDGLGRIVVGAPADLVFLRSDPVEGLRALWEIEAVLIDGRLYRASELEAALEQADAHFHGSFYAAVMGAFVELIQGGFSSDRSP